MEPEWKELRDEAQHVLDQLLEIWKLQRTRVANYGDEQGLEQGFIQPVLVSLGWKLKYQTFLQGRKPDYALFLTDEALDSAIQTERTSPDFWKYPTVVADSKAWHVSLDRSLIIGNQREYPPQQIEWYLDRSHLDFAILTNGKLWRLIPREYGLQQRRFQTYLEFDLTSLLDDWMNRANVFQLFDDFLCFYLFFSPAAFREIDGRTPLLKRAIEGSSEYRLGVGEGLKDRAFEALRLCIEGFLSFSANGLNSEPDLMRCREQSFVLLYRLLFIMYAEDRRLLPYRVNRLYTNNRSLGRHRDQITVRLDRISEGREREDFSKDETALWSDLIDLFDLVDRGHKAYGVPAYNGGLFDPEARPFLAEKKLSDWYVARIVDQLGRASDLEAPGGLFRVDYHDLAIQHLGGIYEGLLELHPYHATEPLVVVSRRVKNRVEEKVLPASMPLPEGYKATKISYHPGEIYLLTDRGERRATGSYYTPDHIVNYIVERTLEPVCKALSEQLQSEISDAESQLNEASSEESARLTEHLKKLRGDFDDRVLSLRVLDPAMGSGHFLLRACQYLAEVIATDPNTQDTSHSSDDESSLTYWKRLVVEHCLYGVDMNELAVELAKLALWLETVAADRPLTFLDHHLRHGNSLIGSTIADLGGLPGEKGLLRNQYALQIQDQLHALLDPLTAIRNAASETAEQVKEKEKLLKSFGKAREPYMLVADLWTSTVLDEASELSPKQYQSALEVLTRTVQFKKLSAEPWFYGAVYFAHRLDINCFHWELEFPEVFFGETGRRGDAGFDAIIGNPPYDVLSELETGHDLTAFRRFIEAEAVYKPSRRGKNNLYKLFMCRALDLLADGGHMGFITPMPVLGDDQAADIRRKIVDIGAFTGVEAFPQKDDPKNRVFPEAKLSTAVFTLVKGGSADAESRSFMSRVHPGRLIELNSPSLRLSTSAIPFYDPSNYTIVSCSQTDWDLATRIMSMSAGRMVRLKDSVEFFQGEVNETNERKNGNLTDGPEQGKLVTRGASICLYVTREASQGSDLFLNVDRFLSGKGPDTKAFHHRYERVGWQESCPQNNFRRVIAALIPAGEFCNHKVNYLPEHKSRLQLRFVLGLLNSKLVDWYFRLGSTNAAVSHYQIYNLPCPLFAESSGRTDRKIEEAALSAVSDGELELALDLVQRLTKDAPFSPALQGVIVEAVNCIVRIETDRGEIARADRSQLAPAAQPYQDLIDRLFYAMAGLTPSEASGLEDRLGQML